MSAAGAAGDRVRQIWASEIREELLSQVHVIVGYGDIVRDEAARHGRDDLLPDIHRIVTAARDLSTRVDTLVVPSLLREVSADGSERAVEQELRHELRTPLNAIKGYGEMLVEDLADGEGSPLRTDLDRLLAAATNLLSRLDEIVQLSSAPSRTGEDAERPAASMTACLLQSLRPVGDDLDAPVEPGYVLVVDDIEANRHLLARRLTRDGCRVATAAGGREALQVLTEGEFDLVLLDLMMPDMNGFDVLVRMKADERLRRVPVIMITALTETESAIRCIEAGAEDYLPKPFDPVLLRARIRACLEKKRWRDRERQYLRRLEEATARFERLLLSILPRQVIDRLNDGETIIADRFDESTVLFADLVGFTEKSAKTTPAAVVEYLNRLFSEFDAVAIDLGVEKVKTIGDAYMAVAGVPEPRSDHCQAIARMALRMIDRLDQVNEDLGFEMKIRIGIHSGPVVAGMIGTHRSLYDVWGDTVNVASRLEAYSLPNRIQVSRDAAQHLAGAFALEARGRIEVKGRGSLETYFMTGVDRALGVSHPDGLPG